MLSRAIREPETRTGCSRSGTCAVKIARDIHDDVLVRRERDTAEQILKGVIWRYAEPRARGKGMKQGRTQK